MCLLTCCLQLRERLPLQRRRALPDTIDHGSERDATVFGVDVELREIRARGRAPVSLCECAETLQSAGAGRRESPLPAQIRRDQRVENAANLVRPVRAAKLLNGRVGAPRKFLSVRRRRSRRDREKRSRCRAVRCISVRCATVAATAASAAATAVVARVGSLARCACAHILAAQQPSPQSPTPFRPFRCPL